MFRRFYTASVSAFQSFVDLMHGDASALDHNTVYPEAAGCLADGAQNLFGTLKDRGYETLGVRHGSVGSTYADHNFWDAWPERCGAFRHHAEYTPFYEAVESFIEKATTEGKPFALYYGDRVATPEDDSPEKTATPLYQERFEKGFSLLDGSAKRLMDKLATLNLLGNTIVVFFGPYGMDPWKHGIYRGRAHGIVPYADQCWTPMFIYNNNSDICIADQLVSVIDLKPTVMHMLFPSEEQPPMTDPLAGIDILRFRRSVALTQNMFALEREGEGPALGLAKSYAATDGDQRLIVTSDGGIRGNGGMEFYYDPRDPGNTRNFLDFFDLDKNGTMVAFGRPDIIHVHFLQSFKPHLVKSVVDSYNRMRGILYEFVRLKEKAALARLKDQNDIILFPDDAFKEKRHRK
jgi:arylsulfatase A-like enzyme